MRVLVVGSGGREHALAWSIARSPLASKLWCAPGNPGTARVADNVPIAADDIDALLAFARERRVDLTVVGPEAPLCAGIADRFARAGLRVAGPTAAAARLEGSKSFAKAFMDRHGIPTAPWRVFTDPGEAAAYIRGRPEARVVKADGLAAGKGVVVADDAAGAVAAAERLLAGGGRVVVEDRLEGEELSIIALCDGRRALALATSQDHKRALDGDRGPNTGGMGAISPAPLVDPGLLDEIDARVLRPVVAGAAAEGFPFRGVLYAGLMVHRGRPRVLEFNCRFGDPETQPLLVRLQSDLLPLLAGVAGGELPAEPLRWDPRAAVCVVLAAAGYPGAYPRGMPISGVAEAEAMDGVVVFQAGTALDGERLVTAGGRVLGVTALGGDLAAARARAYDAASRIHWRGMHLRRDIGLRAAGGG